MIFDLYGTLIRLDRDTSPYSRLARLTHPDNPRKVVLQSLLIDSRGISDFAARLGLSPTPEVAGLESDLEQDIQSARVFDDVNETLTKLRGGGWKLGLISNLAAPYKEPFYRHGLADYFDATLFSCDAGIRKPDPEVFLRMAKALGVRPGDAVMIGDSLRSDYEGATAVGMGAILLRRGGGGPAGGSINTLRQLDEKFRP